LIIECKDHSEDTIKAWMNEDIVEINQMQQHKSWLESAISRNSMNYSMRDPLIDHLDDVKTNLKQLKRTLVTNYAETYNILPQSVREKVKI